MLRAQLRIQMRATAQSFGMRAAAIAVTCVVAAWIWIGSSDSTALAANRLATSFIMTALVAGGCFVGWRLAQFPKSRAAEFQLVTPSSDAKIILAHALTGMLRVTLILSAALPFIVAGWGLGAISASQVVAVSLVPLLTGTLAGLLLAVVAYEPVWLRRLLERLVLVAILLYLFLFGLLGSYFVPRFYAWKADWQGGHSLAAYVDAERWINPFRLMREVGGFPGVDFAARTLTVGMFLAALILLCWWRLSARLRTHYYEENYGNHDRRSRSQILLGTNPLSWWTARRVSRFKGNVNLYLAWATVGLYSCWLLYRSEWPSWLAVGQLRLIEAAGGEAMLAAACFHLALVPMAFLSGLWDSNMQERSGRLELLLTTPLAGQHFLAASIKAAWMRGRGYVLACLVMWMATAASGRIAWSSCVVICCLGLAYAVLYFAAAFAHFSQAATDKAVASRGLAWAVFLPLVTVALFVVGLPKAAAMTPLGSLYIAGTPRSSWANAYDLTVQQFSSIVLVQIAVCWGVAILLTRTTLARFDAQIRASQWNQASSSGD